MEADGRVASPRRRMMMALQPGPAAVAAAAAAASCACACAAGAGHHPGAHRRTASQPPASYLVGSIGRDSSPAGNQPQLHQPHGYVMEPRALAPSYPSSGTMVLPQGAAPVVSARSLPTVPLTMQQVPATPLVGSLTTEASQVVSMPATPRVCRSPERCTHPNGTGHPVYFGSAAAVPMPVPVAAAPPVVGAWQSTVSSRQSMPQVQVPCWRGPPPGVAQPQFWPAAKQPSSAASSRAATPARSQGGQSLAIGSPGVPPPSFVVQQPMAVTAAVPLQAATTATPLPATAATSSPLMRAVARHVSG